MIRIDSHPLLVARAFETRFPAPLADSPSPEWLTALLSDEAEAPLARSEELRTAVRKLLRHGGYRPTGRGKPASEYLVRAAGEGALGSINAAVDACNAVSLHGGMPISVVDLDLAKDPFAVRLGGEDEEYVFNRTGQTIKLAGLLCLCDAEGPCANAVKDSQRTKTHEGTTRTLSIVWGHHEWVEHLDAMVAWYREVLEKSGATTSPVACEEAAG